MEIIYIFRVLLAFAVAGVITSIIGLFTLTCSVPYRFLIDPWARKLWKNPFEKMLGFWSWILHGFCLKKIMGVRENLQSNIAPAKKGELVISIINHPTNFTLTSYLCYLTRAVNERVLIVAKNDLIKNIKYFFIGPPLWGIRGAIFIKREDKDSAINSIRQGLARDFRGTAIIAIIPDMRRPTLRRIAADRKKFAPEIPGIRSWLRYSMMPRSGGLFEILSAINQPFRIINGTMYFVPNPKIKNIIGKWYGATLYHIQEETDGSVPINEMELRNFLNKEWKKKNERIGHWVKNTSNRATA